MTNQVQSAATGLLAAAAMTVGTPAWPLTGIQVGPSGKTYASAELQCDMHPTQGMSPMAQAGLYNPRPNTTATVSVNSSAVARVSLLNPDVTVWLPAAQDTVRVALNRRVGDAYAFDATPPFAGQANVCMPDTRANTLSADIEHAASGKSYTTVPAGCALNPSTGRAQPYVNLFDNGLYLLNVSLNNVPLTQLNGTTRLHTPVFLSAGLNVIAAANGAVSTDVYVRDGGSGTCMLQ